MSVDTLVMDCTPVPAASVTMMLMPPTLKPGTRKPFAATYAAPTPAMAPAGMTLTRFGHDSLSVSSVDVVAEKFEKLSPMFGMTEMVCCAGACVRVWIREERETPPRPIGARKCDSTATPCQTGFR